MASPPLLLSSSMSPGYPQQQHDDHLLLSRDRKFALHGEIMMLIFLLLFAVFLSFLFFLFMKRYSSTTNASLQEYSSDQHVSPNKFSGCQPPKAKDVERGSKESKL